jgi:hypothetical protein
MSDVSKVYVPKPQVGGAVSTAPQGTVWPTDAITPLNSAFKNLGFLNESGYVETTAAENTEIKAWGGTVVKTSQKSFSKSWKLAFIEVNEYVLKEIYGSDNVTVDANSGNISIVGTSAEKSEHPWVIETLLDENTVERLIIPLGKITEISDITYSSDSPISFEVTITAYPFEDNKLFLREIAYLDSE